MEIISFMTHARRVRRAVIASAIVALAIAGLSASASAAPAHAGHLSASHVSAVRHHRPRCIIDDDGDCLQTVKGTAEATNGLNIRSGPGTGYSIVGVMPNQSTGTVYCFATGTVVNGDPYWDSIVSSYGDGYVADTFLFTNGNINQQVDHC